MEIRLLLGSIDQGFRSLWILFVSSEVVNGSCSTSRLVDRTAVVAANDGWTCSGWYFRRSSSCSAEPVACVGGGLAGWAGSECKVSSRYADVVGRPTSVQRRFALPAALFWKVSPSHQGPVHLMPMQHQPVRPRLISRQRMSTVELDSGELCRGVFRRHFRCVCIQFVQTSLA